MYDVIVVGAGPAGCTAAKTLSERGYHAACAIAKNFSDLDSLYADYRQNTNDLKSYMVRQWSLVGRMADTFKEMRL